MGVAWLRHVIMLHGRCCWGKPACQCAAWAGSAGELRYASVLHEQVVGALRYACVVHVRVALEHSAMPQSTIFDKASAGMTALTVVPCF